ncbi:cyclase family protein, partial [Sinorhizobium meliloti]
MCDACVIESVKQRMVSRRGLLRAAAVGTAGIAAGHGSVTDLTHELHEEFPTFFGQQQFFREQK